MPELSNVFLALAVVGAVVAGGPASSMPKMTLKAEVASKAAGVLAPSANGATNQLTRPVADGAAHLNWAVTEPANAVPAAAQAARTALGGVDAARRATSSGLGPVTTAAAPLVDAVGDTSARLAGALGTVSIVPSAHRATGALGGGPGGTAQASGILAGNAAALLAPANSSLWGARRVAPETSRLAPSGGVSELLQATTRTASARLSDRLRAHPDLLEADGPSAVAVRGEVLALALTEAGLDEAQAAGFRIKQHLREPALDLDVVVLTAPHGMSAAEGRRALQSMVPHGVYELNHLFIEAGQVAADAARRFPPRSRSAIGSVGLVDHGVDASHPALRGVRIRQQGFAGGWSPGAHGLATASLLVASGGRFRGPGAPGRLYVADVYGSAPTGSSAAAVLGALAWMAREGVPVINVSLVGPRNAAVETAIAALVRKGHLIVAAAGNDGPTAPPLFPAAYAGVVAVTAVDGRDRVLPEAGRGQHVAFAAPGADMAAAGTGGYVRVRGTSFAAPLVAARLARFLKAPDPGQARAALARLRAEARDLGVRGHDPIYGQGLVAGDARIAPKAVAAHSMLLGR